MVDRNGALTRAKNVTAVQRTAAGRYAITLAPNINALTSVPQATLNQSADWKSEIYAKVIDASTVSVLTAVDGNAADEPFFLLVP